MAKHKKAAKSGRHETQPKESAPQALAAHPPARHPTLLAVSIVLFALWFIFLLVTALAA